MRRTSEFGSYHGYSWPSYDGYERRSQYIPMRDGVRLAVDFFLPTRRGKPCRRPIPAIFQLTPYNRAQIIDGELVHVLSPYRANGRTYLNNLTELCRHGYVVVAADVRGQGASFGAFTGCMTAEEGRDAADVIAWLVQQPWCSGTVGMLGSSYGGQTQFLAAAERPPGLAALFPCHSLFDAYDVFFPGGAREVSLPAVWGAMVDALAGRTAASTAAPVDGPDGPALLAAALAEHCATPGASEVFREIYAHPLRDGTGYFDRNSSTGSQNLAPLLPRLRAAAIPAYHWGGWNDYYPGHAVRWFVNWDGAPARLTLGPWTHSPRTFSSPRDLEDVRLRAVEALRWFDFWLKGVPNGIIDESPIHYAVQAAHRFRDGEFESREDSWEWRSAERWPLDGTAARAFSLAGGRSTSVASVNDGRLLSGPPGEDSVASLVIDPTVGTGEHNRLGSSLRLVPQRLPEMTCNDERSLTWTTDSLVNDLVVAGTPVVTLHASATAADVNLVLWLEDVDTAGRSTLVTYGNMLASHRQEGEAPWSTGGAVWHLSTEAAVAATPPLNAGTSEIRVSLMPVANRFRRAHRVRLTLAGADYGNLEEVAAGETLRVLVGPSFQSRLELPLLDPSR